MNYNTLDIKLFRTWTFFFFRTFAVRFRRYNIGESTVLARTLNQKWVGFSMNDFLSTFVQKPASYNNFWHTESGPDLLTLSRTTLFFWYCKDQGGGIHHPPLILLKIGR